MNCTPISCSGKCKKSQTAEPTTTRKKQSDDDALVLVFCRWFFADCSCGNTANDNVEAGKASRCMLQEMCNVVLMLPAVGQHLSEADLLTR